MALSPLEKINKQKRTAVNRLCNKLKMDFQFGAIKTWRDIYRGTGYDDQYIAANFKDQQQLNSPVTIVEVTKWCGKLISDLERSINDTNSNVQRNGEDTKRLDSSKEQVREELQSPRIEIQYPTKDEPRPVQESVSKIGEGISQSNSIDESGFKNEDDYGLQPSPKEKAYLYWFQKKATKELFDKIVKEKKPAVLLLASTGTGKTFITAALDRRLKDINFEKDKTWGTTNYISITRSSVVEQTKRVNRNYFDIKHPVDTEVINIEQLRARAGQIWIMTKNIIVSGEEVETYEWKPMLNPCVLYLDECQGVKNETSKQHKIIVKYSDIKTPTTQVYISATPFARVSEAKAFAIATRKDISHIIGIPGAKLTAATWPTYASVIAGSQSLPTDYNEAAVDRLMDDLSDYIVRVKGVRWQFNAINKVEIINFDPPMPENDMTDTEKEYKDAWERYLIKKAKLEESVTDNPLFQMWVEQTIFLSAAEFAKRFIFAKRMFNNVKNGKAAVLAIKYKKTLIGVVKILNEKYGVSRDNISLIWGGGQTQLTAKQKLKAKVMENYELFKEQGISMEDMMLEDVEMRILEDLPEHLRLGNQSKDERQNEIDKFQSGRSLYCIFTEQAGGVGLSLHHTDEMTRYKCRRQKNGYVVVEDVKNVPTRPRKVDIGPTWSAIGMVQKVGRVPRLTSLSDTEQTFLMYRGTVEEDQAFVLTHKLKCLTKVVRQRENWQDIISNHDKAKELAREYVEKTSKDETDEAQTDLSTGEEESEDE